MAFRKILKIMRLRMLKMRQVISTRRRSTVINAVKISKASMGLAMHGKAVVKLPPEVTNKPSTGAKSSNIHDTKFGGIVNEVLVRNNRIEEVNTQVSKVLGNYYARMRAQTRAVPLADRLDAALLQNNTNQNRSPTRNQHRDSFLRLNRRSNLTNKDVTTGRKSTMSPLAVAAVNANDGRVEYGNNRYLDSFATAIIVTDTPTTNANYQGMYPTLENELAAAAAEKLDRQLQTAPNANPDVGEYLVSTPIYYGATVALQARHGGYLSYGSNDIKASAHKVLANTRFVVKKSDDLTDVGTVRYGDALWLQTGGSYVLGAQYGSLVDKKRTIQPALVSCRRASMFKAQQYGRWIVLNRDNPVGMLGKTVGHLDRIILEQEWCYLSSNSPSSSSMFRIAENSDDAIAKKVDLFRPPEEAVWRMVLVALPSEEGDGERQRQLLLQQAKDQIDSSEQHRLIKGQVLLSTLESNLPENLRDDNFMSTHLQHRNALHSESEYMLKLYREMESRDFTPEVGGVAFLSAIYGRDSPIVALKADQLSSSHSHYRRSNSPQRSPDLLQQQQRVRRARTPPLSRTTSPSNQATLSLSRNTQHSPQRQRSHLEVLQDQYWDLAQKLLVDSRAWEQLPRIMEEFQDKDRARKEQAARVIQAWIRSALDAKFNYIRKFRRIDRATRSKLEKKLMMRRKLLLEHGMDSSSKSPNKQSNSSVFLTESRLSSPTKRRQSQGDASSFRLQQSLNHNVLWQVIQRFRALGRQRRASLESGATSGSSDLDVAAATAVTAAMFGDEQAANNDNHKNKHEHHEHQENFEKRDQDHQAGKRQHDHRPHLRRVPVPAHHINHLIYADEHEHEQDDHQQSIQTIVISDPTKLFPPRTTIKPSAKKKRPQSGSNAYSKTTHNLLYNTNSFILSSSFDASNNLNNPNLAADSNSKRPTTAPSRAQYFDKDEALHRLGRSQDHPYGLPADVFDELHGATNLKTGLKFLRAMSTNNAQKDETGIVSGFKELRVTRRTGAGKASDEHIPRPKSGAAQRSMKISHSTTALQQGNNMPPIKQQRPQSSSAAILRSRNAIIA